MLRWSLLATNGATTPAAPSAVGLLDLAERAEYHGIGPLLHAVAERLPDLDPGVAGQVEASYHHSVRRHLFLLDDLAAVDAWWSELGHPWLVVKGPVLAETCYQRPDRRAYIDLDLVVPRAGLEQAVDLLVAHGAEGIGAPLADRLARGRGEIELRLPSGAIVDLHWRLINMPGVDTRFNVPTEQLFERARLVEVAGRTYRTLGHADTLVHLALHAVLSGGDRLIWINDLGQVARAERPDWRAVADVARSWGAELALATQLRRSRRLLGAALIPDEALAATSDGRVWAATCRAADAVAPPERSTGELSIAKRFSRATGPTTRASWSELGAALRRGARRAVRRR